MKRILKRLMTALLVVAAVAVICIAFLPSPIEVETSHAVKGPLVVTVDEDGETRAHDRFVVAAPVNGRLSRIDVHDGDAVTPADVIAILHPTPLDARERAEAIARVDAAQALEREAEERMAHARADHDQARRDLARAEQLARDGVISRQSSEQAINLEVTSAKELEAAKFKIDAAASEVRAARSRLIAVERHRGDAVVILRAPVRCHVLRVLEKSERVVVAGTPLVVLGDPAKLEVVVDLLSTDAVRVSPGARVLLENWGGDLPLSARVRTIEPYAFTKVSSLGIEEQRANVIADFVNPAGPLGDGYRVEARIVIWESARVLKIPSSALFRAGEGWAVFRVQRGRARQASVIPGHRNGTEAEILGGLEVGAEVILHPANNIHDGSRVRANGP